MASDLDPRFDTCDCKVGRGIARFGLADLDDVLATRRRDGASLRDLADLINRRVLKAAVEAAVADDFDDETALFGAIDRADAIDFIYETLKDESVQPDRRARIESRLAQAGVDLEAIRGAWVTHPTVRTHLRDCLGIDTSAASDVTPDEAAGTIEWARSRCVAIVGRTIDRLAAAGHLSITDPDVTLSIRISCTECHETFRPSELLTRGRCACSRSRASGADPATLGERD